MNNRILITYATRTGSTIEVAAAIGDELGKRGFAADVKPVKENPKVDGYQAVLIGSAIRMGSWLPEAVEFVTANQQRLNRVPVVLFTVHGNNRGDDEQSRTNRKAYLDTVRPLLQPVDEVFFAGVIDSKRLSLLDRLATKMVKATLGDFRDWGKIRGWAQTVFT